MTGAAWVEDCLFCRSAGPSGGEEHVLSPSLGNSLKSGLVEAEIVLPPEEICCECNQRRLSTGDKAMTQWGPLSIRKTLLQIPNRRGRLTDAAHGTVWEHDFADGQLEISVTADLNNPKRNTGVARAMCKIAVEMAWLIDRDDARSERWDELRSAALTGRLPADLRFHANFTYLASPEPRIRLHRTDPGTELDAICEVSVCGVPLAITVGQVTSPPTPGIARWTVDEQGWLTGGPPSMWMRFGGTYDELRQLRPDEPAPSRGSFSQLPTGDRRRSMILKSP